MLAVKKDLISEARFIQHKTLDNSLRNFTHLFDEMGHIKCKSYDSAFESHLSITINHVLL